MAPALKIAERPEAYPIRTDFYPTDLSRADLCEGLRSCVHQRYVIFFSAGTEQVRTERILYGTARAISKTTILPC